MTLSKEEKEARQKSFLEGMLATAMQGVLRDLKANKPDITFADVQKMFGGVVDEETGEVAEPVIGVAVKIVPKEELEEPVLEVVEEVEIKGAFELSEDEKKQIEELEPIISEAFEEPTPAPKSQEEVIADLMARIKALEGAEE